MAAPTGTFQTYTSIGSREDLQDYIYDISPLETPFLSKVEQLDADNTLHEWQSDTLSAPATNRQLEGDDASFTTRSPTSRFSNYTQIMTKDIVVSGTQQVTRKAGRKNELSFQIAKAGKELKRDIEFALVRNQASSAGGAATARSLGSVESWLNSTSYMGYTSAYQTGQVTNEAATTGFAAGVVTAPTDACVMGASTEAKLKLVIQQCWENGGDPTTIMVGGYQKTKISAFSGIATQYRDNSGTKQATILGAAGVYISDFGEHKIIANRYQRGRTILALDLDYWGVAWLRRMQDIPLAKTGDSEKRMLLCEGTLVCKNPLASGKYSDVSQS